MIEFISPKAPASRPNSVPTMAAMNRTKFSPRVPTMKTATSTTTMSGPEPHVTQSLPDPPLAGRRAGQLAQRRGGNLPQAQQQGHERDGVDQEHPARADGHRQHAGHRGSDHPGDVEGGTVECHRVGQVVVPDQFGDEGLPHRRVQGGDHAQQQGKAIDMPQLRRRREPPGCRARCSAAPWRTGSCTRSCLRLKRSATRPATGARKSCGPSCRAMVMPMAPAS